MNLAFATSMKLRIIELFSMPLTSIFRSIDLYTLATASPFLGLSNFWPISANTPSMTTPFRSFSGRSKIKFLNGLKISAECWLNSMAFCTKKSIRVKKVGKIDGFYKIVCWGVEFRDRWGLAICHADFARCLAGDFIATYWIACQRRSFPFYLILFSCFYYPYYKT